MIRDTLSTDRLALRKPEAGDLRAYTAYCTSDRSRFVGGPFSATQAFEKFAAIAGHWTLRGYGRYVITSEGAPLGHAGLLYRGGDQGPEHTWSLWSDAHEGRGIATEAARAVADHLLRDAGWQNLIMRIHPDNLASRRVAERIGAVQDKTSSSACCGADAVTYTLNAEALA